MKAPKRKLIEVALPLETINRESAREKSIRHGHPSTVHLWWARRPLAAARVILFAQLVDDPSSHPERFPTEEDQRAERERLHRLMERLAVWENARDSALLFDAHQEILRSTDGKPPPVLDPFAGGGTIPLEAKRLGLSVDANDLNPLSALINVALLQLVDRFSVDSPVSGGLPRTPSEVLADDLRFYAAALEKQVKDRVGYLYPAAADDSEPLVYFWARTVTCSNPECGVEVPLVGSWVASDRRGSQFHLAPEYNAAERAFDVRVHEGLDHLPVRTMHRTGATCPKCEGSMPLDYVKAEGVAGRMGTRLLALQVRKGRSRSFQPATDTQRAAAVRELRGLNTSFLDAEMSTHSQYMAPPRYGMNRFRDLFSIRQLTTLITFVEALDEIEALVLADAKVAGLADDGAAFARGGSGALAYAEAVRILLALGIGRLINRQSTLCIWHAGRNTVEQVFARQAYSMNWLFAEANPFGGASGSFSDKSSSWRRSSRPCRPDTRRSHKGLLKPLRDRRGSQ